MKNKFVILIMLALLTLLAGCSNASEKNYLREMKDINNNLSNSIGDVSRSLAYDKDPQAREQSLTEARDTLLYQLKRLDNSKPPKKYKKEHEDYGLIVAYVSDSVLAQLKGDEKMYRKMMDKAEEKIKARKSFILKINE